MVVFNSKLNEFSRKYLIKNAGENQQALLLNYQSAHDDCLGDIVEQLLLFDKISIKVLGENLPLAILISDLGLDVVFELIEENVIEFVLWTPNLTTLSDDDLLGKVMPVQSGNYTSTVHSIPEESARIGISSLRTQPNRHVRRDLIRKVSKVYKVPSQSIVHDAANLVMSAYSANKFEALGMRKEKDVQFLEFKDRIRLLELGESVLETAILAEYQYSSYGNYSYYEISHQSMNAIKKATNILNSGNEIFKIEHLPDIRGLIKAGALNIKDILKLRRRASSQKFRAWLENNGEDSEYVVKAYIDEIANHKGLVETTKGKFAKIAGMYAIGSVVGGLVAGVPGALIGVPVAQAITEIGLSAFDSFFLERILKGWTPKIFINEYERLLSKKA